MDATEDTNAAINPVTTVKEQIKLNTVARITGIYATTVTLHALQNGIFFPKMIIRSHTVKEVRNMMAT